MCDDSEMELRYLFHQVGDRLDQHWLATLGYRKIETDNLVSDLRFDQYSLGVSYSW
jgi:hypothetical protein